jgi:hypothetical protein
MKFKLLGDRLWSYIESSKSIKDYGAFGAIMTLKSVCKSFSG